MGTTLAIACDGAVAHITLTQPEVRNAFSDEAIADIRASGEGKEGVQSFLHKRKPAWLQG